jgi:SpoVK/Ycf46/Vps4 family AAA+-type ATPase
MAYVFKKIGETYMLDTKTDIKDELPSNVYKVSIKKEGVFFDPLKIVKDDLIRVPNSVTDDVLNFIDKFTSEETKKRYVDSKFVHKAGILLEGPAGSGKSGTLNLIIDDIIKKEAIVFFDADPEVVAAVLPAVREQNPNKLICVVYEEFDEWLTSSQATINSFLDGQLSVNNMIVLATTNYISKIPARIKNRPSRFQIVKHVGVPDEAFRRAWFTKKLTDINHADKIEAFVGQSEGMVVDQMKDLIVSHIALEIPLIDAVKKLQTMADDAAGVDDYVENEGLTALRAKSIKSLFSLGKGFSIKPVNPFDDGN